MPAPRPRPCFIAALRALTLACALFLAACQSSTAVRRYQVPDPLLGEWHELDERDFRDSIVLTKDKITWTRRDPLNAGDVISTPDVPAPEKVKTVVIEYHKFEIYSPLNYDHPDWFHVAPGENGQVVVFRILNRRQLEGARKVSSLMQVKLSLEDGKLKMESLQRLKDILFTPKLPSEFPIHETQWFEKVGG